MMASLNAKARTQVTRYARETTRLTQAAKLLTIVKDAPDRLDIVHELQRMLIRELVRTERRIIRLKKARHRLTRIKARERLSKEKAKILKTLIKKLDERIDDLRHLLFLWRCFGDGIPAIYQSKYSLKHLFYGSNYNVKEEAGFLSGKAGFRKEYKALCLGIRMQVPVVMSDLTNIIRHGDVCGLGGRDPVPIEMKSSTNLNARVSRQTEQLQILSNFYANDGAANFRGMPNTIRVELKNPEVTYERDLNECMLRAQSEGIAVSSPEPGLHYFSFSLEYFDKFPNRIDEQLAALVSRTTLFVQLTPEPSWLPLYPFTLSMNTQNVIPFIQEDLYLAVLIDMNVMKSNFQANGIHATVMMDGIHALQICPDPSDLMKGVFRISEQLFLRVACEFQSLRWFVEEHSLVFSSAVENLDQLTPDSPGLIYEPLPGWQGLKCLFDDSN